MVVCIRVRTVPRSLINPSLAVTISLRMLRYSALGAWRDVLDKDATKCVFKASRCCHGARKVWHVLRREGSDIAWCTVDRLMRGLQLQGPSRQNCHAIRLPGNGCARQEGGHDLPRSGAAAPGRQGNPSLPGRAGSSARNSSVRFSPIVSLLCCSKCYQRSGIKPRQVQTLDQRGARTNLMR